jgi:hypothetical protein
MGMYDTFYLQDNGRTLDVQSKAFARILGEYHLGDFVNFDQPAPSGVTAYIEDHKQDWQDPTCPVEWVVLVLVDGCFVDSFVAPSQSDAQQAADVMAKLWAVPERQAEAFKRFARSHFVQGAEFRHVLNQVLRLLQDYANRNQQEIEPYKLPPFMQHDFDKESWDMALARLLSLIPEFAADLPASYGVALALENNKANHQGEQ